MPKVKKIAPATRWGVRFIILRIWKSEIKKGRLLTSRKSAEMPRSAYWGGAFIVNWVVVHDTDTQTDGRNIRFWRPSTQKILKDKNLWLWAPNRKHCGAPRPRCSVSYEDGLPLRCIRRRGPELPSRMDWLNIQCQKTLRCTETEVFRMNAVI